MMKQAESYREHECESICNLIVRNEDGMNLCVDGNWGVGKTWFCASLQRKVEDRGFKSIYFDAFKSDYQDDPLIAILAEMAELKKSDSSEFFKRAARYAAPLMKTGIKLAIRAATLNVVQGDEASKINKEWQESASESLNTFVEDSLFEYTQKEASIEGLKDLIINSVIKEDQGLVIIIDELDRCRPTYALEVIEKIKHVFNIPKVTFVISMNKKQMIASIENLYGKFEQTETYLEKFLDFTFYIEAKGKRQDGSSGKYCSYLIRKKEKILNLGEQGIDSLEYLVSTLADNNNLTFRECEKFVDSCLRVDVVLPEDKRVVKSYEMHASLIVTCGFLSWAARDKAIEVIEGSGVSDQIIKIFYVSEGFRDLDRVDKIMRSQIGNSKHVEALESIFAILLSVNHNMNNSFKGVVKLMDLKNAVLTKYEKSEVLDIVKDYMRAGCGVG